MELLPATGAASSVFRGGEILGTSSSGEQFRTYAPAQYEGLANRLLKATTGLEAIKGMR